MVTATKTPKAATVVFAPAISQRQLEAQLAVLRGATIVTILSRTEPRIVADGNRFRKEVFKISRVNGMLNAIYANSVNNQREREGSRTDFVPEPRKWGEKIDGTPLVMHKGDLYLTLKVERSIQHSYVWKDGAPLTDAETRELETHLYKTKQPDTQKTKKPIIVRDYKMSNVIAITMGGQQTIVVPLP